MMFGSARVAKSTEGWKSIGSGPPFQKLVLQVTVHLQNEGCAAVCAGGFDRNEKVFLP